ncbi:MAG: quinolinate synthase NadA [Firmicutes bacterium]|nr:quinolinate synthase NadA [Bacillota bacterium]
MLNKEEKLKKIQDIKKEYGEDLLILAHHYQNNDIVSLADYTGDSLKLAKYAQENKKAKYVVFCGVHFMAETADILTEDWQKVLLPAGGAGCPMADMANLAEAETAWEVLKIEFDKDLLPVTYVNSRADIKAFCGSKGGSTVTSGNAPKVMEWALSQNKIVLFLPDRHLGENTAYELGIEPKNMAIYNRKTQKVEYECPKEDVRIVLWDGYCHVHHAITVKHIEQARNSLPEAKIIVHPECPFDVVRAADGYGSTEYLINTVKNAPAGSSWVVGTESNLVARVKAQNTDKQVYILDTHSVCTNMNKTNLDNLLETLEDIKNNNFSKQVKVSKDIAEDAVKSLDTMLELC